MLVVSESNKVLATAARCRTKDSKKECQKQRSKRLGERSGRDTFMRQREGIEHLRKAHE
jgi:hypothetical protein